MATAQPEKQYLFGSSECHGKYMAFIQKAVESAVDGQQGRQTDGTRDREKGGQKGGRDITLYIASAPQLHAHTLWEIVRLVHDVSNLHVVYYFRDKQFKKIIDAANNETVNEGESEAQKARRLITEGTTEERALLKSYFSENKNHEVRRSSSGKKLFFHTKWTAFHDDQKGQVELLLTSANLLYDHLKGKADGSDIINSLVEKQLPYAEFEEKIIKPINIIINDGHADLATCDVNTESDEGTRQPQTGNYSDVEVYKQVESFVNEAVVHSATLYREQKQKTDLHVVASFYDDELILESLLDQTQQARKDNHLGMSIVFKDASPEGLVKVHNDIVKVQRACKESANTRTICSADDILKKHKSPTSTCSLTELQREHGGKCKLFVKAMEKAKEELAEWDWTTGVQLIRTEEFHCKFLAYGPTQLGGQERFIVLMMSANVDTRHMGGNSKKDPSYHNLDWITKLNFSSQEYIGMLKTLPTITPLKLKNSRDKYQQLTCNTIEDLVAGCEGTSVDQLTEGVSSLTLGKKWQRIRSRRTS